MIGSPTIQHKPPNPGYIDVIQSLTKWNPTRLGVGGWEKRRPDAEAVGYAEGLPVSASWRGTGESLGQSNRLPRRIDSQYWYRYRYR